MGAEVKLRRLRMDEMRANPEWKNLRLGVIGEEKEDGLSYGYEDGPLNALEVMSALKIAGYIAEQESDTAHANTYNTAYTQCFESPYSGGGIPNDPAAYVNGKG